MAQPVYLIFSVKEDAVARSRSAWEQVLGKPKNPEDVTEFLWPVHKLEDGTYAAEIDADTTSLLSEGELSATVDSVVFAPLDEI